MVWSMPRSLLERRGNQGSLAHNSSNHHSLCYVLPYLI